MRFFFPHFEFKINNSICLAIVIIIIFHLNVGKAALLQAKTNGGLCEAHDIVLRATHIVN